MTIADRPYRLASLIAVALLVLFSTTVSSADDLRVLPNRFTLSGPKASQRVLVERLAEERFVGDVTKSAQLVSSNPKVAVIARDGTVTPVGDGTATITAKVGRQTATAEVMVTRVRAPFAWSFRNHILPVLTKATCNGGSCHGAAAGKGGLKLTLRGFDPLWDHNVLTRQAMGRRVTAYRPDNSLLVLKPTNQIGHGGGERIKKGSRDHQIISQWIEAGAQKPAPSDPQVKSLDVYPAVARLKKGDAQQIIVRAIYSDGHAEDVTRWVKFGTSDGMVATVDDNGAVKVAGSGEAAITVWFSSKVAYARVVSPFEALSTAAQSTPSGAGKRNAAVSAASTNSAPDRGFIDRLIDQKLAELNLPASGPCTDEQFIRRAYLDAAGSLPKAAEVEAFVRDVSTDKRARLIDRLLTQPEFVDYWTYKWSDLFLVSSRKLSGVALTSFYNWIRRSVEENKPWDRVARDILTARGSNLDNGAANFWLLHKEPIDQTETVTQAFLGMSVQCARCHNHPLEKWTQSDYYQMANLFARMRLKNGDRGGEVLAIASQTGDINHPRLGRPLPPRPLEGSELALDGTRDRREALADWLTRPENPYFAKAIINRIWRSFMGRALVEVEDDLRLTNPPSNQELFDALAKDFVANGYDVRRLMTQIMSSEAYQRSPEPVGTAVKDDRYYSHYLVRRLPAEVLLDAVSHVTGIPTAFEGYPKGTRALQLRDSQVGSYFLTAFGRPNREQTCSCERTQEPNVAQALHLANGDTINVKLRTAGGVIDGLVMGEATDEEAVRTIYLSALSREPTSSERVKLAAILAPTNPDILAPLKEAEAVRRQALEDLFWAVLTDREFLFNH